MVMRTLAAAIASVVLAACTVGPDYVRPTLPPMEHFANAQDANVDAAQVGTSAATAATDSES